ESAARVLHDDRRVGVVQVDDLGGHHAYGARVLAVGDEGHCVDVAVFTVTNLDVHDPGEAAELELEVFFSGRHHRWLKPFFSYSRASAMRNSSAGSVESR